MKNVEFKSQELGDILGFEIMMQLRYRLDLTHKNRFSGFMDLSIVLAMALQSMDGGNWW